MFSKLVTNFEEARNVFELAESVTTEEDLTWAAQVAVGLDRRTSDFDLRGLTYYYRALTAALTSGWARG